MRITRHAGQKFLKARIIPMFLTVADQDQHVEIASRRWWRLSDPPQHLRSRHVVEIQLDRKPPREKPQHASKAAAHAELVDQFALLLPRHVA